MTNARPTSRPDATQVASRVLILERVVLAAQSAPRRDELQQAMATWDDTQRRDFARQAIELREATWGGLRGTPVWQHVSPNEEALSQTTMLTLTQRQQVDASWRVEAGVVALWALRLLPRLPSYDAEASGELFERMPLDDPDKVVASARLRPATQIDRARDVAELWHWRSRTRELIERGDAFPAGTGAPDHIRTHDDVVRFTARRAAADATIAPCIDDDFPAFGKAYRDLTPDEWEQVTSITRERHFALNWLCGAAPGNRWDETPTQT